LFIKKSTNYRELEYLVWVLCKAEQPLVYISGLSVMQNYITGKALNNMNKKNGDWVIH